VNKGRELIKEKERKRRWVRVHCRGIEAGWRLGERAGGRVGEGRERERVGRRDTETRAAWRWSVDRKTRE